MEMPRWQFLTVALIFLIQTGGIDGHTTETIRRLGKVKIQPISIINALDQGKRLATTRCVFHGPRDLTGTFSGIIDGPFNKGKDIDKDTSEYEAVFQSSIDVISFGKIELQSASTLESLAVDFDLPEANKSFQTNFPFTNCKFEVQRTYDEQTNNYSAFAKECGKMARGDLYLYFPVKLTNSNSAKYAKASTSFYHSPETKANIIIKANELGTDGVDMNSLFFSVMNFYGYNYPLSHFITWSVRLK